MKKILTLSLLIGTFLNFCFAITLEEIISGLKENRQKVTSYEAEVVNTVSGPFIEQSKAQTGYIYFQAPDNIRSDVYEPVRQTIVSRQGKSYVFDHNGDYQELEEVENTLDKEFADPLKLFEKFDFTISQVNDDTVKLVGIPRSSNSDVFSKKTFSKVVFVLDKKKKLTKEIRVHNAKGKEIAKIVTKYSEINGIDFPIRTETYLSIAKSNLEIIVQYNKVKLNEPIPASVFDLKSIQEAIKANNR